MKTVFLTTALFFGFFGFSAAMENPKIYSSYTEVATLGPVVFATGPFKLDAIIISSPAPNSFVAFFRSTSPFITPGIGTQTLLSTSYVNANQAPVIINMGQYGIENDSYTLVSKEGTAKLTYIFRLVGGAANVTPPGLKVSGQE